MEFMANKAFKSKSKNIMKTYNLQSSTLMKPTASHLAKQNLARGANASVRLAERFDVPLASRAQQILEKPSVTDNQASKRQKLEGGHLCKVPHMQEQSNWTHKVAKKNVVIAGHPEFPRPKLTIPREPELVTARRALRIISNQGTEVEHASRRTQSFKARPLNRKIFEPSPMLFRQKSTPQLPVFQEFHLKTSERARQHVSAASLMHLAGRTIDHKVGQKFGTAAIGLGRVIQSKKMECPHVHSQRFQLREDEETMRNFNSHRLNKKNFSNEGVSGNFVTRKPFLATTLMESEAYNDEKLPQKCEAYNDERLPQNLASELFSKLSLSDLNKTSRLEVKALKENVSDSLKQGFKASQSTGNGLSCNGRVERILSEIRL